MNPASQPDRAPPRPDAQRRTRRRRRSAWPARPPRRRAGGSAARDRTGAQRRAAARGTRGLRRCAAADRAAADGAHRHRPRQGLRLLLPRRPGRAARGGRRAAALRHAARRAPAGGGRPVHRRRLPGGVHGRTAGQCQPARRDRRGHRRRPAGLCRMRRPDVPGAQPHLAGPHLPHGRRDPRRRDDARASRWAAATCAWRPPPQHPWPAPTGGSRDGVVLGARVPLLQPRQPAARRSASPTASSAAMASTASTTGWCIATCWPVVRPSAQRRQAADWPARFVAFVRERSASRDAGAASARPAASWPWPAERRP